jgi:uncharacterized protein YegJ (DUF2314 family)
MKNLAISILIILSINAYADDDFHLVNKSDKRMNAAFSKAKNSLDQFLKVVESRPEKFSNYSAYVKIEDDGETEYLWVVDVKRYDEKYYMGVIVNEPRLVGNVKYGQTIGYVKEDIFDWQYYEKSSGKTYGGFTTCVLLDLNNPEDVKYMKKRGLQCDF